MQVQIMQADSDTEWMQTMWQPCAHACIAKFAALITYLGQEEEIIQDILGGTHELIHLITDEHNHSQALT